MAKTLRIEDGDVVVSSANGRPILISDIDKAHQDIIEFFQVEVLPSGFGAGLDQLIGVLSTGDTVFTALAYRQITEGLMEFRTLQRSNLRIPRTANEKIVGANGIKVTQDPVDPTKYYFTANIITESGKTFPLPQIKIGGQ